jgi:hypothetical protein
LKRANGGIFATWRSAHTSAKSCLHKGAREAKPFLGLQYAGWVPPLLAAHLLVLLYNSPFPSFAGAFLYVNKFILVITPAIFRLQRCHRPGAVTSLAAESGL